MPANSNFDSKITVHGGVSPDLQKATGFTIEQLQKITKSAQQMQKQFTEATKGLNGMAPAIQHAQRASSALADSLKRVGEIAAGVSIGETIAHGFETALGIVERIGEKLVGFDV